MTGSYGSDRPDHDRDDSEYFENLYRSGQDPWAVQTSHYEQRKLDILIACLPEPRFGAVFEPACGIGVLTARLASRCDRLLATDMSACAVSQAQARVREQPHVCVTVSEQFFLALNGRLWPAATDMPDPVWDLVVLSEFVYYLSPEKLNDLESALGKTLKNNGWLLACHATGEFSDRRWPTSVLHARLGAVPGLISHAKYQDQNFMLELWKKSIENHG